MNILFGAVSVTHNHEKEECQSRPRPRWVVNNYPAHPQYSALGGYFVRGVVCGFVLALVLLLAHNPAGFVDLVFPEGVLPSEEAWAWWWDFGDGEKVGDRIPLLEGPKENDTQERDELEKEKAQSDRVRSWVIPGDVPVVEWPCEEEVCWWDP